MLITGSHDYNRFGKDRMTFAYGDGYDIIVEEGVWIGSGSIIIGPCILGKHSVIGAGSVVTKDVAPYSIIMGNPARVLNMIKEGSD